jgi:hypothetical protein
MIVKKTGMAIGFDDMLADMNYGPEAGQWTSPVMENRPLHVGATVAVDEARRIAANIAGLFSFLLLHKHSPPMPRAILCYGNYALDKPDARLILSTPPDIVTVRKPLRGQVALKVEFFSHCGICCDRLGIMHDGTGTEGTDTGPAPVRRTCPRRIDKG